MRSQYAEGVRAWSPNANLLRPSRWTTEHDDLLHSLVGTADLPTLARTVSARTGVTRTEQAVKRRLDRIGISRLERRPLTTGEVARMLGMSRNNLLETWVGTGRLRAERWRGGPHGMLVYDRDELARFVRAWAESLDVGRMRDSGLKALGRAAARGRLGLDTRTAARLAGVSPHVARALCAAGLVPSARRVRRRGSGAGGGWVVDRADVEAIRRLAAERRDEQGRRRSSRPRGPDGRFESAASGPIKAVVR